MPARVDLARSSRRSSWHDDAARGRATARRAAAASGCDISARAIASICCSPPESVPAVCSSRSFRRGKSAKTAFVDRAAMPPVACASRRPSRGSRAPSGWRRCRGPRARCDDAHAHELVRGRARDVARRRSGPRRSAAGTSPDDRAQRRRLAGAVGADQRHDLALPDRRGDTPLQRVDRAVGDVDRSSTRERWRAHAARPGRPRSPSGSSGSPPGVPDGDRLAVVEHLDPSRRCP